MINTTPPASPAKASWSDVKAKLKAKFNVLTDSDLTYEEGKKDEMMNKLQIKLGKTKDELTKLIAEL